MEEEMMHIVGGGATEATKTWLSGLLGNPEMNQANILNIISAYSGDDAKGTLSKINTVDIMKSIAKIVRGIRPHDVSAMPRVEIYSPERINKDNIDIVGGQIIEFLTEVGRIITTQDDTFLRKVLLDISEILKQNGFVTSLPTDKTSELLDAVITSISLMCKNIFINGLINMQAASRLMNAEDKIVKYFSEFLRLPRVQERLQEQDKIIINNIIDFIHDIHGSQIRLLNETRDKITSVVENDKVQMAINNMIGMSSPEENKRAKMVLEMMIAMTAVDSIVSKISPIDKKMAESITKFRADNPRATDKLAILINDIISELSDKMNDKDKQEVQILGSILMGTPLFSLGNLVGGRLITVANKKAFNILKEQRYKPRRIRRGMEMMKYNDLYDNIMTSMNNLLGYISKNEETLADETINKVVLKISENFRSFNNKIVLTVFPDIVSKRTMTIAEKRTIMQFMYNLGTLKNYLLALLKYVKGEFASQIAMVNSSIDNMVQNIINIAKVVDEGNDEIPSQGHIILRMVKGGVVVRKVKLRKKKKTVKGGAEELEFEPVGDQFKVESDIIDTMPLLPQTPHISEDGTIEGGAIHDRVNKLADMKVGDILLLLDRVIKPKVTKVKAKKPVKKKPKTEAQRKKELTAKTAKMTPEQRRVKYASLNKRRTAKKTLSGGATFGDFLTDAKKLGKTALLDYGNQIIDKGIDAVVGGAPEDEDDIDELEDGEFTEPTVDVDSDSGIGEDGLTESADEESEDEEIEYDENGNPLPRKKKKPSIEYTLDNEDIEQEVEDIAGGAKKPKKSKSKKKKIRGGAPSDTVLKSLSPKSIADGLRSLVESSSILRTFGYKRDMFSTNNQENLNLTLNASREIYNSYSRMLDDITPRLYTGYTPIIPILKSKMKSGIYAINLLEKYISDHKALVRDVLITTNGKVPLQIVASPEERAKVIMEIMDSAIEAMSTRRVFMNGGFVDGLKSNSKIESGDKFAELISVAFGKFNRAMFPPSTYDYPSPDAIRQFLDNKRTNPFEVFNLVILSQLKYINREYKKNTAELEKLMKEITNGLFDYYKALCIIPEAAMSVVIITNGQLMETPHLAIKNKTDLIATLSRLNVAPPNGPAVVPGGEVLKSGYISGSLYAVPQSNYDIASAKFLPLPALDKEDLLGPPEEKYVFTWAKVVMPQEGGDSKFIPFISQQYPLLINGILSLSGLIMSNSIKQILGKLGTSIDEKKVKTISNALMLIGGAKSDKKMLPTNLKMSDVANPDTESKLVIKDEIYNDVFNNDSNIRDEIIDLSPMKWSDTTKNIALLMGERYMKRLATFKKKNPGAADKDETVKGGNINNRMMRFAMDTYTSEDISEIPQFKIDQDSFSNVYKAILIINDIMELIGEIEANLQMHKAPNDPHTVVMSEVTTGPYSDIITIMRNQMIERVKKGQIGPVNTIVNFDFPVFARLFKLLQDKIKSKSEKEITKFYIDLYETIYSSVSIASIDKKDIIDMLDLTKPGSIDDATNPYDQQSRIDNISTAITNEYNAYNPDSSSTTGIIGNTSATLDNAIHEMSSSGRYGNDVMVVTKTIMDRYKKKITMMVSDEKATVRQIIKEVEATLTNDQYESISNVYFKFIRNTSTGQGIRASSKDLYLTMLKEALHIQFNELHDIIRLVFVNSPTIPMYIIRDIINNNEDISWGNFLGAWQRASQRHNIFKMLSVNEYASMFNQYNPIRQDLFPNTAVLMHNTQVINPATSPFERCIQIATQIGELTRAERASPSYVEKLVNSSWPIYKMSYNLIMQISIMQSQFKGNPSPVGIKMTHGKLDIIDLKYLINNFRHMSLWMDQEIKTLKDTTTKKIINIDDPFYGACRDLIHTLEDYDVDNVKPSSQTLSSMIGEAFAVWKSSKAYFEYTLSTKSVKSSILSTNMSSLFMNAVFPYSPGFPQSGKLLKLPAEITDFNDKISNIIRYVPPSSTKPDQQKYNTDELSRVSLYSLGQTEETSGVHNVAGAQSTLKSVMQCLATLINCGIDKNGNVIIDWINEVKAIVDKFVNPGLYPDLLGTIIDVRALIPNVMTFEGTKIDRVMPEYICPASSTIYNKEKTITNVSAGPNLSMTYVNNSLKKGLTEHMVTSNPETKSVRMGIPQANVIIPESLYVTLRSILDFSKSNKAKLVNSTSTITIEMRERIAAALATLTVLLEHLECDLHCISRMIEQCVPKRFEYGYDKYYSIIKCPCVKPPTEFNVTKLEYPQEKSGQELKGLITQSVESQKSLVKYLIEFVDKKRGQIDIADYIGKVKYTIDGDVAKTKTPDIMKTSIMMKNVNDNFTDINEHGITSNDIELPDGAILIGSKLTSMTMAKQNEINTLKNQTGAIWEFKSALDDKRKTFNSSRNLLSSNVTKLFNIYNDTKRGIQYTPDANGTILVSPRPYNDILGYELNLLYMLKNSPSLPSSMLTNEVRSDLLNKRKYNYDKQSYFDAINGLKEMLINAEHAMPNMVINQITGQPEQSAEKYLPVMSFREEVSRDENVPIVYVDTTNIPIYLKTSKQDELVNLLKSTIDAVSSMLAIAGDIINMSSSTNKNTFATHVNVLQNAGFTFTPMSIFHANLEWSSAYYDVVGSHTTDSCIGPIAAFAGHTYRTVNQFILAYFAPVVEMIYGNKEIPKIVDIFSKSLSGITLQTKNPNTMKALPAMILNTLGMSALRIVRYNNKTHHDGRLVSTAYKSAFKISEMETTNEITQTYSDYSHMALLDMPAMTLSQTAADKIVVQEISNRGLMMVFSLRGILSVMTTNVNLISTGVMFREYVLSWYNEDNPETLPIRQYFNLISSGHTTISNAVTHSNMRIILGTDKFAPRDIGATRKLLLQRYPVIGQLKGNADSPLSTLDMTTHDLDNNNLQMIYSPGTANDLVAMNDYNTTSNHNAIVAMLNQMRCDAINSCALRPLLLIDMLSSLIYEMTANVSMKQFDIDFLKTN